METSYSTLLKNIVVFQEFLNKRGREMIMSTGCDYTLDRTAIMIDFNITGVDMKFEEYFPDNYGDVEKRKSNVFLDIAEIEMNLEDWNSHIKNIKLNSVRVKLGKLLREQKYSVTNYIRKIDDVKKEYEELKKELE